MIKNKERDYIKQQLSQNIPHIEGKKILIYGMGNTAKLYYEGFQRLEKEGFSIEGYCSSFSDNQNEKIFLDKKIYELKELIGRDDICVLICTPNPNTIQSIVTTLDQYKIQHYLVDETILKLHASEVLECYDMLEDEKSKSVYADIVLARMEGRYPLTETCEYGNAYFAIDSFLSDNDQEVFVDCGAFVGDTVEKFIWNRDGLFKKIIAFEPDQKSFEAMKKRVNRLKEEWNLKEENFVLRQWGVADRTNDIYFENYAQNNGLGNKFTTADEGENIMKIKAVSIDETIKEPITFLKADIESYEYKMLLGAENRIKNDKPLLAICIYHNVMDLFQIPLLIKTMVAGYKMSVRHHLGKLAETVLYCWYDKE